jgi:hypothetical protein
MPTARRNGAHFERFPCCISIFELSYVGVRARLETHISTQSAGALKLNIQVRFHRPLHRRSLQRDVQNTGTAMNPHWLHGFPRRPRRRLRFSAATRTQARERSRLAGAIRSHSCDRDGVCQNGATCRLSWSLRARPVSGPGVDTGQHLGQAALRALQVTKPGARCRHPADRRAQVGRSRRVSDRPAPLGPVEHDRGAAAGRESWRPGQLEGNGPYLVAPRSPGQAPGGPGTGPGLNLASTPSASTAPGRDGDRRGGTSHRAGRCWPAAWAASPPPVRRCGVPSLRRPRWLRACPAGASTA